MGYKQLEEVLSASNELADLTDEQMWQAEKDVNEIGEKAEKLSVKVKQAVKSVRAAAKKLDEVWEKHNIAHAVGNVFGIIGGICTIGGGVATLMTAGLATPLLVTGLSLGLAGAGTNAVAKIIELVLNSNEIKKANKDLEEASDNIAEVKKLIENRLDKKEKSYLLCMYNVAAHLVSHSFRFLVAYLTRKGIVQATKQTFVKTGQVGIQLTVVGSQAAAQGAQAAGKAGAEAGSKVGAQAAGKAGGAAGKAGAQAASEGLQGAVKAGGQVADDVVQAGVKSGVQLAAKVVIGLSAVMVAWDAIDLSLTINDLVKEKGSEAAQDLREKADELEEKYIKKINIVDGDQR